MTFFMHVKHYRLGLYMGYVLFRIFVYLFFIKIDTGKLN